MNKVFKIRMKQNAGTCPKGYETQVVSDYNPPSRFDVKKVLEKEGFRVYELMGGEYEVIG